MTAAAEQERQDVEVTQENGLRHVIRIYRFDDGIHQDHFTHLYETMPMREMARMKKLLGVCLENVKPGIPITVFRRDDLPHSSPGCFRGMATVNDNAWVWEDPDGDRLATVTYVEELGVVCSLDHKIIIDTEDKELSRDDIQNLVRIVTGETFEFLDDPPFMEDVAYGYGATLDWLK